MKKLLFLVAGVLTASTCFSQSQPSGFQTLGGGDPRAVNLKGGGDPYVIIKIKDGASFRLDSLEGGGDPFIQEIDPTDY